VLFERFQKKLRIKLSKFELRELKLRDGEVELQKKQSQSKDCHDFSAAINALWIRRARGQARSEDACG
jgi:hypothetical protein